MAAPSVYSAVAAVASELAPQGIAKTHFNEADQYHYRSIDDVLNRLAPLLSKHKLCIFPQVLERTQTERVGLAQELLLHVTLKVAFDLVSADDGSCQRVEAIGEALDHADKGTAKAMSAAYKSAMLQTFCIPVAAEDAEGASPRLTRKEPTTEPVQGWQAWAADICDIVCSCESERALRTVQERNRDLLFALSRARPELYKQMGEEVARRQQQLRAPPRKQPPKGSAQKKPSTPKVPAKAKRLENA